MRRKNKLTKLIDGAQPPPTEDEKIESLQALSRFKSMQKSSPSASAADQKALASFCHALVNSAAFLYID